MTGSGAVKVPTKDRDPARPGCAPGTSRAAPRCRRIGRAVRAAANSCVTEYQIATRFGRAYFRGWIRVVAATFQYLVTTATRQRSAIFDDTALHTPWWLSSSPIGWERRLGGEGFPQMALKGTRRLARGGLSMMTVDVDVHVRSPARGPGQPAPAVLGITRYHPGEGDAGRDANHDGGDGRDDDRHRLRPHWSGAEHPARHQSGDQTNAPSSSRVIEHGEHPFPIPCGGPTHHGDSCA